MLIYDGDCGFCTSAAGWLGERLPEGYLVVPYQHLPDLDALGVTLEEVSSALHWIEIDGTAHRGHRAVGRLLIAAGRLWSILGWMLLLPPVSWIAAVLYDVVSRFRYRLPGATPACAGVPTRARATDPHRNLSR